MSFTAAFEKAAAGMFTKALKAAGKNTPETRKQVASLVKKVRNTRPGERLLFSTGSGKIPLSIYTQSEGRILKRVK